MKVYGFVAGEGEKRCNDLTLSALNHRLREAVLSALLTGDAQTKARESEIRIFDGILHRVVDDWIDSGKKSGVDLPWERIVPINLLRAYMDRHPAMLNLLNDGSLCLLVAPCPTTQPDPTVRVGDVAVGLLLQLLDSPARARLSRCDACATYFMRARNPKKNQPIYRGTFCHNCKGKASAKRTNATRDLIKEQRVDLAAKWWPRWKPTRRYGDISEWIAGRVNEDLPRLAGAITKKWVTQNQTAIEAKVALRASQGKE
jgi:hypothetical protein